jgi:hypothetical protein
MALIQTADDRMSQKDKINIMLASPHGVGKTTLARTLPYAGARTLFIDLEAGMAALRGEAKLSDGTVLPAFAGGSIDVRKEAGKLGVHPWAYTKALACLLGGPDPAASERLDAESGYSAYSKASYGQYVAGIGDPSMFDGYDTIFVDSGSVASRMAWAWCLEQPRAFNKQGKQDTLGAYGLVGDEMIGWATQLQHIPNKSVIVLFALDVIEDKDIPGRISYVVQSVGSRTERELPGIFDNVMTLGAFTSDGTGNVKLDFKKGQHRGLICTSASGFGVPGKDRFGRADPIEAPNLAALMTKLSAPGRKDQIVTASPQTAPTQET